MSVCEFCGDNTTVAACDRPSCLERAVTMEEAQTLADEVRASEAIQETDENELCRRFALAVSVMQGPKMSGVNPMFNSRYSTLDDLIDAIREPLGRYELAWSTRHVDGGVIAWVRYRSAEWTSGEPIPPFEGRGNKAHAYGSSHTYQRRYALMGLFNLAGDPDDDGNAVGDSGASEGVRKATEAKKPKQLQGLAPDKLSNLKELAAKWHPSFEQYPVFAEFISQAMKTFPEYLNEEQYQGLVDRFSQSPAVISDAVEQQIADIEQKLETPF